MTRSIAVSCLAALLLTQAEAPAAAQSRAARMEAIEARGEDPFWLYSLPEAALRLKQGFGRLIRTREDRGAVLVLDDRILTRRYGPYLRQSLPPAPLAKGLWGELRRGLEDFYGRQ